MSKVHAGSFPVSVIHRTVTWTTGSLTSMRDHSFACVYIHTGVGPVNLSDLAVGFNSRGFLPTTTARILPEIHVLEEPNDNDISRIQTK